MNTVFVDLPDGSLFLCPSGDFSRAWLGHYLGPATLFLKRSQLVVVAFYEKGFESFPVGADYGDVPVVHIPFLTIHRTTDDDLRKVLRELTRPY